MNEGLGSTGWQRVDMQSATGATDLGEAEQKHVAPRRPSWPTTDLPAAADQAERSHRARDGGWPEELTLEPRSKSRSCSPRSTDLRRWNADLFLHDEATLLPVVFPAAGQLNDWLGLRAAMPRCDHSSPRHRPHFLLRYRTVEFVLPNVRAEAGPTAGRQGPTGENVPRTARRALVACRWASPRARG